MHSTPQIIPGTPLHRLLGYISQLAHDEHPFAARLSLHAFTCTTRVELISTLRMLFAVAEEGRCWYLSELADEALALLEAMPTEPTHVVERSGDMSLD